MIKKIKKWLGLCDHEYEFTGNVMMRSGAHQSFMCNKCYKLKYLHWSNR